ncbi:peptidoglycan DD-metalloendopeptidase family protein [Salimicrobium jeotgali]|nr:peptidoglycan DD-metalloendopeptidase family protein [Salimicrobium jeotgali]MBM7696641.1 murein DD-endopeptidase MepM/ murein hydrolase activator NlpD/gas vesicle protein [Salimicrobium jeotgali]
MTGKTSGANKEMRNMESKTRKFSKMAKGAAVGAAGLASGAAAGATALGGLVSKASSAANEINKYSQVTGMSTKSFQEWDYVAQNFGFSMEAAAGDMAMLSERAMDAAAGTGEGAEQFKMLGIEVNKASGGLKSQEQLFGETITALQGMEDTTKRNAIATAMLGTTGEELAPVLNMSNEELKKMKGNANVISEDNLSKAATFKDSWNKLKNTFSSAATTLGVSLMPAVQLLMDWFIEKMPQIQAIVQKSFDVIGGAFSTVTQWVQSLISRFREWKSSNEETMSGIWQTIQTRFGQVVSFLQESWSKIQSFWQENGQSIMTNAQEIFGSIRGTVMTVFNAAWTIIQEVLNKAVPFIQEKLGVIQKFWDENGTQIMQAVKNAFSFIQSTIEFVMPLVLGIIKMVWKNIEGVISGALDIIMGLVKTFSGLFTGDFSKMWEGIKQMFSGAVKFIWNFIQLTFYGKILKGAKAFILSFKSAFAALWSGLKSLFTGSVSGLVSAVKSAWSAISSATTGIFTGISNFLKSIWSKVYGFVMGFVTDLWTGIKIRFKRIEMFTRQSFRAIRDFLQNIWSSIVTSVSGFVEKLRTWIGDTWNSVSSKTSAIFSGIWEFLKSIWSKIYNSIVGVIANLWANIQTNFVRIKMFTRQSFRAVRDFLRETWDNIVTNISNSVKSVWNWIKDTWNTVSSKTSDIFSNIKDTISEKFDDVVEMAKNLPGRIGDGLKKMGKYAINGAVGLVNKIGGALEKGINTVIGGLNGLLGKLGIGDGSLIGEVRISEIPKYATGTGSHPGGPAVVGDGGMQEFVQTPRGDSFLSPATDTLIDLPKGSQVMSGPDTKEMMKAFPHYENGIGSALSSAWGNIKDGAGWIKDQGSKVFDWVAKGGKAIVSKVMEGLGIDLPTGDDLFGGLVRGSFNFVKDKLASFVGGKTEDHGNAAGSGSMNAGLVKTSSFGRRFHPIDKRWKLHGGDDYGGPMGTPIPAQTSGRVSYAGWAGGFGNLVKVASGIYEHLYAHLNSIGVRTGQSVKRGDIVGRLGTTGNSTGPHLHYEVRKNGVAIPPIAGYENGTNGPLKQPEWAVVGESGPELMRLNRGAEVFSNRESKSMASKVSGATSASGKGTTNFSPEINVTVEGNAGEDTANRVAETVEEKMQDMFASWNRRASFAREG